MRSPFQTMTKRFRVRAYADDVAEVVVDLNHDDYEAVATVLTALNDVSKTGGYVPTFEVAEVDADGEVKRVVIPL